MSHVNIHWYGIGPEINPNGLAVEGQTCDFATSYVCVGGNDDVGDVYYSTDECDGNCPSLASWGGVGSFCISATEKCCLHHYPLYWFDRWKHNKLIIF